MVEIRKDYFSDILSIVLPNDAVRESIKETKCLLCPGNEEMTPPADLVLVKKGETLLKQSDTEGDYVKDWVVRVFPNKFPYVSPNAPPSYGEAPHYSEPAVGYHYTLVATPKHEIAFHKIDTDQWTNILASLQDKVRWLYTQRGVSYVSAYVDYYKDSNPSISHPNIQIITTPKVPPTIEKEAETVQTSMNELGICPMCRVVSVESSGPRQVLGTESFIAFTPWVSRFPYEFWVYPRRHQTSILKLSQKEMTDLALMLRSTLGGMAKALGNPDFSLIFHNSSEKKTTKQIHWHIEVFPRIDKLSGLEIGTGIYLNKVPPEIAAQQLGSSSRKELAQLVGIS
jgi:UDPglucose--hexose-1-phosphate uridylyltransferase